MIEIYIRDLTWFDNYSGRAESITETTVALDDGSHVRVNLLMDSHGNVEITDAMHLVDDGTWVYSESFPWNQIRLK